MIITFENVPSFADRSGGSSLAKAVVRMFLGFSWGMGFLRICNGFSSFCLLLLGFFSIPKTGGSG